MPPLKLVSPSSTCLLVISDNFEGILDLEDALRPYFSLVLDAEHCNSARILKETYSDKANSLYMHFLHPVF